MFLQPETGFLYQLPSSTSVCVHSHAGLRPPANCAYSPSKQQQQQQQQQQPTEAYSQPSWRPQPAPTSHRRVSCSSASGLQSPPYEEQEDFDATLPTDELKSALFGPVNSQQQTDLGRAVGLTQTAAASAASSRHLRQQVLQQLHVKQDKPADLSSSHDLSIPAHHQKACEPFVGFVRGQEVRHNARLWNMPLAPKLAAEFSLHNNPLAEQHSERQVARSKTASPPGLKAAMRQQPGHDACFEPVLSLSELASIDPSQL